MSGIDDELALFPDVFGGASMETLRDGDAFDDVVPGDGSGSFDA